MRIDTKTTKVYPFEELSEESQQKALERFWDINANYDWWDCIFEDAKTVGFEIAEFDLDRNKHCKGKWTIDAEDCARLIIEHHGESCKTRTDAETFLTSLAGAKAAFEEKDDYDPDYEEFDESEEYEELCEEFHRTICEDYASMLQAEADYLQSEKAIVETIKANEYEFTEDGKLYC